MPRLSAAETDDFLATREILMRIAVTDTDGAPMVTPIWFLHEAGAIYFTPRAKSAWFECLRRDPRAALCIDEQPHPYRKVLAKGSVELVFDVGRDDGWRDLYRRIAHRYVPDEAAETYVQNTIEQPRALYRLELRNAKVTTWRMPTEGEDAMGIWHDRYYVPGTKF
jgi:nitroimidazol reductase NimA-like FMN-containing flavoprotein (pyridoxamine 5'-phosphate oxidase superfamily)